MAQANATADDAGLSICWTPAPMDDWPELLTAVIFRIKPSVSAPLTSPQGPTHS